MAAPVHLRLRSQYLNPHSTYGPDNLRARWGIRRQGRGPMVAPGALKNEHGGAGLARVHRGS
jgi:hypothetical protein